MYQNNIRNIFSDSSLCVVDFSRAARLAWVKRSKDSRKTLNQGLVEFITDGKVEAHLVGIYRGTVPSRRHDHYTSEDDDLRQKLKHSSWWGPIDDQVQQVSVVSTEPLLVGVMAIIAGRTST